MGTFAYPPILILLREGAYYVKAGSQSAFYIWLLHYSRRSLSYLEKSETADSTLIKGWPGQALKLSIELWLTPHVN